MRSILKEFAYGNISPDVRYFKRDSEYGRALKALTETEEKLLAALTGADKELFNEYIKLQLDVLGLSCTDKFIYGYRLGVLMTTDVFTAEGNVISGDEE